MAVLSNVIMYENIKTCYNVMMCDYERQLYKS